MTTAELAGAAQLPGDLDTYADVIEAEIERSGWRGLSPAQAARVAGCTTDEARTVIAHLVGHQRAYTTGTWKHINRRHIDRRAA
jgi:hypothetical protein